MKKLMVVMAMVVALALMVAPVYAAGSDDAVITVSIVVNPWIELSVAPADVTLTLSGSADVTNDTVAATVLCNTNWGLSAAVAGFLYADVTAAVSPAAGDETAVGGDVIDVDITVSAIAQDGTYLGPDQDDAGTVTLTASVI